MKVVTIKLNEESWAYIISDTEDIEFIQKELLFCVNTAVALYPQCKISIYGIDSELANQIIEKTKERRMNYV